MKGGRKRQPKRHKILSQGGERCSEELLLFDICAATNRLNGSSPVGSPRKFRFVRCRKPALVCAHTGERMKTSKGAGCRRRGHGSLSVQHTSISMCSIPRSRAIEVRHREHACNQLRLGPTGVHKTCFFLSRLVRCIGRETRCTHPSLHNV